MPSIVELAELCDASYTEKREVHFAHQPPAAGLRTPCSSLRAPSVLATQGAVTWRCRCAWHNRVGFYAACYERGADTALVFRGTDDFWDRLVDDASIASGAMPPQAIAALAVVRSVGLGSNAYLAGHSLGGALALITAAHAGLPAVTFNAPGVMDSCVLSSFSSGGVSRFFETLGRCVNNPRVRNLRINGDPVSSLFTTGLQAGGQGRTLGAAQCGLDPRCRHGVRTCVEEVRREPAYFEPLAL
jgi:hypothetical protein